MINGIATSQRTSPKSTSLLFYWLVGWFHVGLSSGGYYRTYYPGTLPTWASHCNSSEDLFPNLQKADAVTWLNGIIVSVLAARVPVLKIYQIHEMRPCFRWLSAQLMLYCSYVKPTQNKVCLILFYGVHVHVHINDHIHLWTLTWNAKENIRMTSHELRHPTSHGSGHGTVAVLLPGFAINW